MKPHLMVFHEQHTHFYVSPSESDGSVTMIDDWIELVQEKNALVSEESDLMVA